MPSLMAILGINIQQFSDGLARATGHAKSAGHEMGQSLGDFLSEKLAKFGSLVGVEEVIRRVVELGDKTYDLSRRLGISTDAVQAWDYALRLSGTTIEQAAPFFEKIAVSRQKAIQGNEELLASFKRLGVSITDLKSMRLENVAVRIATVFEEGDPQKLIADLRAVGGRGAGELAAAFRSGLPQLVASAKEAGVVMAEEVVNQLKEAADNSKTVWMEFLTGVAPAVAKLSELLEKAWMTSNVQMRAVVGFLTGGISGSKDLVSEYLERRKEKLKELEEHRKKSGGPLTGGEDDIAKASAATKHAREILRLQEELDRKQQANDFNRLSNAEKLAELARKRAAIEYFMPKMDREHQLQAAIDIEDIDAERKRLGPKDSIEYDKSKHHHGIAHHPLNELQRIGGMYVTPMMTHSDDPAKRSEQYLKELVEIARDKGGWESPRHAH